MSDSPPGPGFWLASDGHWYPPELHPSTRRATAPPSASAARVFTVLAAFWLWLLLPLAVHYQRRARREAEASGGMYVWPKTLWNRPILLWLIVLVATVVLVIGMAAAGWYGP